MSAWLNVVATFVCEPKHGDVMILDDVFGKQIDAPQHAADENGFWTHDKADDAKYDKDLDRYRKQMEDCREHPTNYLPSGSEGTLGLYAVVLSGNRYIVNVWGGLRDRDESNFGEVKNWFNRACSKCEVDHAICYVESGPMGAIFQCHYKDEETSNE